MARAIVMRRTLRRAVAALAALALLLGGAAPSLGRGVAHDHAVERAAENKALPSSLDHHADHGTAAHTAHAGHRLASRVGVSRDAVGLASAGVVGSGHDAVTAAAKPGDAGSKDCPMTGAGACDCGNCSFATVTNPHPQHVAMRAGARPAVRLGPVAVRGSPLERPPRA